MAAFCITVSNASFMKSCATGDVNIEITSGKPTPEVY